MPSISERSRNNIRAGVFVTVAMFITMGVIVAVTDVLAALGRSTNDYVVTFDMKSGVSSLKAGSEVRVGGLPLGKVISVKPDYSTEPLNRIDVEFKVDSRVALNSDATIMVWAPLIGTEAALEISSLGSADKKLAPGERITGTVASGMLDSFLGAESSANTREIIANAKEFSEFLTEIPEEYRTSVKPIFTDAGAVMSDLRNEHWPKWAQSVDNVMAWAESATASIDSALEQGEGMFTDVREVIAENRDPLKNAIASGESALNKFDTDVIDRVVKFLETAQQGLDEAKAAVETFRIDYDRWATDFDDTMANFALASQQLKLALIETRRSPWKILYRPEAKELEHELLYEATRSFAVAAADLKTTSESVRRILANHGDQIAGNEEVFRKLQASVEDSLARYQKAQQDMLEVLLSDRP